MDRKKGKVEASLFVFLEADQTAPGNPLGVVWAGTAEDAEQL